MNKKELSAAVARKTGLSQVKAAEVVNAIFDADEGIIPTALYAGTKVTIPGFGTFLRKNRAARIGTNPSNGARIEIPSKPYAYFKAGKTLREKIEA